MLPAATIAEITTNLATLHLEPTTTAAASAVLLSAVSARWARHHDWSDNSRVLLMRGFLLAGVAPLSLLAAPAHATITTCAFVKPTPDGFLNLREEPKMGAKIIGRLKPGQELQVVAETTTSPWTQVEVIVHNQKAGKYVGAWVSSRFLRFFRCEDDD